MQRDMPLAGSHTRTGNILLTGWQKYLGFLGEHLISCGAIGEANFKWNVLAGVKQEKRKTVECEKGNSAIHKEVKLIEENMKILKMGYNMKCLLQGTRTCLISGCGSAVLAAGSVPRHWLCA